MAVIHLLSKLGETVMLQYASAVSALLMSNEDGVSLEMIRALRKYMESRRIDMKLFVAIRNAFVTLLHRKSPTFHQRMLKKKALILLSKNRRVAFDMKPFAERLLADSSQDVELQCESLRLLARAGLVGEEM